MIRRPPRSPLFPSTTLFRSRAEDLARGEVDEPLERVQRRVRGLEHVVRADQVHAHRPDGALEHGVDAGDREPRPEDRKSTRLNSSHLVISYAVFCLKIKNTT